MLAHTRAAGLLRAVRRRPILRGVLPLLAVLLLWASLGQDCRTGVLHFRSTVPIAELRVDIHPSLSENLVDPGPNRTVWRGRPEPGEAVAIPYAGNIYTAVRVVVRTEDGRIFADHGAAEVFFYGDDYYAAFDGRRLVAQLDRPAGWPFDLRGWLNHELYSAPWFLAGVFRIGDALSCMDAAGEAKGVL